MTGFAYVVGMHRYHWRAGKPLRIVGVEWSADCIKQGLVPRACYRVCDDSDGATDLWPIEEDRRMYKFISREDALAHSSWPTTE